MKKYLVLAIVFLVGSFSLVAQEMEHGEHTVPFNKPDAWIANLVVWVSVGVVFVTLIWTLIYLFKPGEKNPDHIKNIVVDERF